MAEENSSSSTQNYIVERILDKRVKFGKTEYKIQWQGYSVKECTWEPIAHLNSVLYMVKSFDDNKMKKDRSYYPNGNKDSQNSSEHHDEDIMEEARKHPSKFPSQPTELDKNKSHKKQVQPLIEGEPQQNGGRSSRNQIFKRHGTELNLISNQNSSEVKHLKDRIQSISNSPLEFTQKLKQRKQVTRIASSEDRSRSSSKDSIRRSKMGSYGKGDRVREILDIRQDIQKKRIEFYVSWKKRKNGKQPLDSWVNDKMILEQSSEVLSKYLLSKIKWPQQL